MNEMGCNPYARGNDLIDNFVVLDIDRAVYMISLDLKEFHKKKYKDGRVQEMRDREIAKIKAKINKAIDLANEKYNEYFMDLNNTTK